MHYGGYEIQKHHQQVLVGKDAVIWKGEIRVYYIMFYFYVFNL